MMKVIKNSKYLILICLLMVSSIAFAQTPGSRYTGTYKKSDPIVYKNKKNIVIEGLEISNIKGRAITLWSCENVIIRNCKIKNLATSVAIYAEKSSNITIEDCSFENIHRGVMTSLCTGDIKVEHNDFKNVLGDKKGGSVVSFAVQFNKCQGKGNSISYNAIENISGESSPGDIINIFASNGTSESPIIIKNNWIRGGGPYKSGGGILLGDWGGSYQIAENNIVVNPGQYGMGIAGGNNITLRNNKIFGKRQSFTNVGLSICNWTPNKTTGKSYNITVENNEINWRNRDGKLNKWWVYKNMNHLQGLNTNKYNSDLDESILPEVIINRARTTDDNENQPTDDDNNQITKVYTDSFNRIAIKYFASTIPKAYGELFTANGKKIEAMNLPRFNTVFPLKLSKGTYYVRVTYPNINKKEISKIVVN